MYTKIDLLHQRRTLPDIEHMQRTSKQIGKFYDYLQQFGWLDSCMHGRRSDLCLAANFHDIGKIAVPSKILNKPCKLADSEWQYMKKHTTIGAQLVRQMGFDELTRDICLYHHERWDGSGYPAGLAGQAIPYPARLMTIVDVYDALTNERPYKAAYSRSLALDIIQQGYGTQFDPVVCRAFLEFIKNE